jgi:D-aminopeptidase
MSKKRNFILLLLTLSIMGNFNDSFAQSQSKRMRDYGIEYGIFKTGKYNAITDVPGVSVGQVTLNKGNDMRTGVTAIIPHQGNIFKSKVPAAFFVGNGFGKLAGTTQIQELGNIETPIVLTNTLNVSTGMEALITYTLQQPGNENVHSVNAVVGETNDGELNNIRARYVKTSDVLEAIKNAKGGPVEEGCVGAGTGTICFSWKGGIGTSSRVLPKNLGGYTVGVLVQTNYGGVLEICGVQVGQKLGSYSFRKSIEQEAKTEELKKGDGSCMIVVITDAPCDSRNLQRIARRAIMGLSRTGGNASNGSGDYVLALSVCPDNLIKDGEKIHTMKVLDNDEMSPIFQATIEATAEALWNSLFAAKTTKGFNDYEVPALPVEQVVKMIKTEKGIK